jgi:hypothetical protein
LRLQVPRETAKLLKKLSNEERFSCGMEQTMPIYENPRTNTSTQVPAMLKLTNW